MSRNLVKLSLIFLPTWCSAQGRLFIEPQLFAEFGTKSPQKEINFSTVYEEYLPFSKMGDINFTALNFGLNIGYQRKDFLYSANCRLFYAANGYGVRNPKIHSAFLVIIGQPLGMIGLEVSKTLKSNNRAFDHAVSFSSSLSLKSKAESETRIDSLLKPNYLVIEKDYNYNKMGVYLGLKYTFKTKVKGKNLVDLSVYYQQGFRTINTLNVKLINLENNAITEFNSTTRGSEFGFVISRHFYITKNKKE